MSVAGSLLVVNGATTLDSNVFKIEYSLYSTLTMKGTP